MQFVCSMWCIVARGVFENESMRLPPNKRRTCRACLIPNRYDLIGKSGSESDFGNLRSHLLELGFAYMSSHGTDVRGGRRRLSGFTPEGPAKGSR